MGQLPNARGTSPRHARNAGRRLPARCRERKTHGEHSWFCSAGRAGSGVRHRGRVGPHPGGCGGPSSDWLSSIDGLLSGALPAADPSGLNPAISFDGMSLVQDGNATATTASGEYGLAIAYGDGASATAEGGTGNYVRATLPETPKAPGAAATTPPSTSATMPAAPSTTAPTPARVAWPD
jgi:hypothetical protein